ncbi:MULTISPECIES: hypothetical protein [unclassified Brucella]|uniref:hypothetical protein n=1 Tax=unclassified Brucella TaxID=2632610 RepID=UPI00097287AC|nr:hypothetical protein [Brucella sp. 09RB8471]APX69881.1 hypothetical protein BKD03_11295 [Brucella sp. 09RB8471]
MVSALCVFLPAPAENGWRIHFRNGVWLSCTVAARGSGAGNCLKYFENTGVRPFSGWRGRVAEKRETCQS